MVRALRSLHDHEQHRHRDPRSGPPLGRGRAARRHPALTAMSTDDFALVGPAGFVLTKQQWLGGYSSGALELQSLEWSDVQVREYGDIAVAIGARTQEATYEGRPAGGRFRGTHIAHRAADGRWLV